MKRGKKPTLAQMKIMQQNNMAPSDWLVSKVFPDRLECLHKYTDVPKTAFYGATKL